MPESRRRGAEARHPVLARLPDVSVRPSSARQAEPTTEPTEYVDYRFDAPAGADNEAAPVRRMTRPHSFDRTSYDARQRSPRRASYVQPDSDPFSLPSSSLYDRLAPVARFLVLFALFTAAGTAFLMKGGFAKQSNKSTQSMTQPPATNVHQFRQTLQPSDEEFKSSNVDPTAKAPTASGPKGARRRAEVDDLFAQFDEQPATATTHPPPERTESTLAGAEGQPVPRVQTTNSETAEIASKEPGDTPARSEEPIEPPVIARLPGIILEVSPRQAQHVENQPGLH
jgi:hypothetical protein